MDEWMDRWTDGRMDRRTDGWMDGQTNQSWFEAESLFSSINLFVLNDGKYTIFIDAIVPKKRICTKQKL